MTTTNAHDLLVGANVVATGTAGPGFTSRMITSPGLDAGQPRGEPVRRGFFK